MTTNPHHHLTTITTHWADLHHALPTPTTVAPYGLGLTAYMAHLDTLDAQEVAELREARAWQRAGTIALDTRPLVIRARVHDTMRAVETALVHCADHIASAIQRPAISRAPRHWTPADRARRDALARQDAADQRRWSYTTPASRTAPLAAVWLTHRLESTDGPFRPLTALHRDHIASVAAGAAQRVLDALDMARRSRVIAEACPHCRGELVVEGGDGRPPAVRCGGCGWTRTTQETAA